MSNLSKIGGVSSGVDDFYFDGLEVLFLEVPTGTIAIALNGPNGGVTTYNVMPDSALDYITTRSYAGGTRDI